ncbi:MAG: hypothetical protein LBC71_03450 [Oscillospiraceae bacterium]|jgi:hypothetical protein|nr:hypothetical protein [Oscillospiraceae bacterium]
MRKLPILLLLLFAISACDNVEIKDDEPPKTQDVESITQPQTTEQTMINTSSSPQLPSVNSFEHFEMPIPFGEIHGAGGGSEELALFSMLCSNGISDQRIDGIDLFIIEAFFDDSAIFYDWYSSVDMNMHWENPVTTLMDYPNLFSLIKTFDLPIDRVYQLLKNQQLRAVEIGLDETFYFTDEEIKIITSLDETAIMEYFVADFSIYHDGEIFTPMWLYYHDIGAYEEVGITPEMVEEKIELYAEFSFTDEADEAFSEKLSEFIGEEVSLRRIRSRNHGRRS